MKSKKKKQEMMNMNRKGIVLIALLAVVILIVNIITFSFSWFEPLTEENKSGAGFNVNTRLRAEGCTFKTHLGEKATQYVKDQTTGAQTFRDQITYYPNELTGDDLTVDLEDDHIAYFRTDIVNDDTSYPSVVSLYIASLDTGLIVSCTNPSNTVKKVTAANHTDFFIARNAYVKVNDPKDVDGPGLLMIEWYVENKSGDDVVVDLSQLHLMYN